jgi:hypothetical protein
MSLLLNKQEIYPNIISVDQFFEYLVKIDMKSDESSSMVMMATILTHINYYLPHCKKELISSNRQLELFQLIINNKLISKQNKKLIFDILDKNDIKYDFHEQLVNILNSNDPNFEIIITLCFLNKSEPKYMHDILFKIVDENNLINPDEKNKIKSLLIKNDIKFDILDEFIKYISDKFGYLNLLNMSEHEKKLDWFVSLINLDIKTPYNCNLILQTIDRIVINKTFKSQIIKYLENNDIKMNVYDGMVLSILNGNYPDGIPTIIVDQYYKLIKLDKADMTLVSKNNETIYHLIAKSIINVPDLINRVELLLLLNTSDAKCLTTINIDIKDHNNQTPYDILVNLRTKNHGCSVMMELLRKHEDLNSNSSNINFGLNSDNSPPYEGFIYIFFGSMPLLLVAGLCFFAGPKPVIINF